MCIEHKLMKVNAFLASNTAGVVKQVHQSRLPAANTAVQIQALR